MRHSFVLITEATKHIFIKQDVDTQKAAPRQEEKRKEGGASLILRTLQQKKKIKNVLLNLINKLRLRFQKKTDDTFFSASPTSESARLPLTTPGMNRNKGTMLLYFLLFQ